MTTEQRIYGNAPAYPQGEHGQIYGGLSIRAMMATQAMVGHLAGDNPHGIPAPDTLAAWSVAQADALIAELCKPIPESEAT